MGFEYFAYDENHSDQKIQLLIVILIVLHFALRVVNIQSDALMVIQN